MILGHVLNLPLRSSIAGWLQASVLEPPFCSSLLGQLHEFLHESKSGRDYRSAKSIFSQKNPATPRSASDWSRAAERWNGSRAWSAARAHLRSCSAATNRALCRLAKRMSQASTNSLPMPRVRPRTYPGLARSAGAPCQGPQYGLRRSERLRIELRQAPAYARAGGRR